MSVERELKMATEYLKKRLSETEDALTVPLGTNLDIKGDEYLENKIAHIKKAIQMIEDIIPIETKDLVKYMLGHRDAEPCAREIEWVEEIIERLWERDELLKDKNRGKQ